MDFKKPISFDIWNKLKNTPEWIVGDFVENLRDFMIGHDPAVPGNDNTVFIGYHNTGNHNGNNNYPAVKISSSNLTKQLD